MFRIQVFICVEPPPRSAHVAPGLHLSADDRSVARGMERLQLPQGGLI